MKKLIFLSTAILISSCGPSPEQTNIVAENVVTMEEANAAAYDAMAESVSATPAPSSSDAGWSYNEVKDEMRGATRKTASVSAVASLNLPWPYGESTPELSLRSDPKYGFDIYVSANGQFLCRSYNGDTISVKFDDGTIKSWACAEAEGGSSDIIFIRNQSGFLAQLKKAKKVIIEANMYEAGRQQMTFNVAGLKW